MKAHSVKPISEKQFQAMVVKLARLMGWLVFHPFDARRSAPGYPDLTMIHRESKRLVVCELKTGRRKLTPEQSDWISLFKACGIPAYVWTPDSWDEIESVLRLNPQEIP